MDDMVAEESAQPRKRHVAANGISVRLFERADIPKARAIMLQHHENTVFRNQPFSDRKLDRHFEQILSRPPRMIGLAAEWRGEPAGLAWAAADSYMLTEDGIIVAVHIVAVDLNLAPVRRAKIFLSLVSAIRQWAESSVGACHSFIHVTTGFRLASTDRLMMAAGAKLVGGSYLF